MVPAPSGDNPVKTPMVDVDAVDAAEPVNTEMLALEEASSEYETDSDDSECLDALSHDGDTIKMLRDEQLRDGLGMCARALHLRSPSPMWPRYRPAT